MKVYSHKSYVVYKLTAHDFDENKVDVMLFNPDNTQDTITALVVNKDFLEAVKIGSKVSIQLELENDPERT